MTMKIALGVAVLALAACGGDESSASDDYANDVCSTLSTYVTDVQNTTKSLTDAGLAIDREDIQTAVDETRDSTDTLVNDLRELGPPETESGEEAKNELDDLGTLLREQLDVIEQALGSGGGAVAITAKVTTALSTAANGLNSTYQKLQTLDPGGELEDAFRNSDDCKSLGDQLENIRS